MRATIKEIVMNRVYLDHSATTPVDAAVMEAMQPYYTDEFGNAASIHRFGQEAKAAVEQARSTMARLLGARESEVFFVSGGTEADNLAIKGIAYHHRERGEHIITSKVEHKAVLEACRALEKEGFRVSYLNTDRYGMVNPEDVRKAIEKKTILISLIHANNEVGTLNPIEEIGQIAREKGVYFHTDAVQSFGKVPIEVNRFKVDLLSISGHKFYGPKGIGALYLRRGVGLNKLFHGGNHEMGKRPGTPNVPSIVGLAKAADMMHKNREENARKIGSLRDYFLDQLSERIENIHLNGHREARLYNNLNISFEGCEADALLLSLDMAGIAASAGSACTSGSVDASHVLKAMGLSKKLSHSAIRFTLGKSNTRAQIDYVLENLERIVARMRSFQKISAKKEKVR